MEHEPGDVIDDHFEVVEILGRGSIATTYAAKDLNTDGDVVIKHMDMMRVDNWEAIKLFQRESDTLRQLDHSSIPDYIDFITYDDGQVSYLVQEMAPGADLERILRAQGRFGEQTVRHIAEQALEILVYLGSRRPPVIHRDVKPENLILDEDDRLYLVDFGAVRDRARRATKRSQTMAGTLGYMAPEQLRGRAIVASDLYALGMTLIHLLTGEHPNELMDDGMRVDFDDRVDVSSEFSAFLTRLVEPMPGDRFASASDALSALVSPDSFSASVSKKETSSDPDMEATGPDDEEVRFHLLEMSYHAGEEATKDWIRDTFDEPRERRSWLEFLSNLTKNRSKVDRVSHIEDEDKGLVVTLDGKPLSTSLRDGTVVALVIAIVGSLIFVAGDPFLGRFWFFFADDWLARAGVWFGTFLVAGAVGGVLVRAHPLRIRLDDGECILSRPESGEIRWQGHPKDLEIQTSIDSWGQPTIRIQTVDRVEYTRFSGHPDDVLTIRRLRDELSSGDAEAKRRPATTAPTMPGV